jgi:Kef-type K+ transport system membrane component KefB
MAPPRDIEIAGSTTRKHSFKGLLLLGIFFFTIGMNIDFRELMREPVWLLIEAACSLGHSAAT